MPDGTHTTFCRICEALCGLTVKVESHRITEIHPDHAHIATEGFSCPKGLKQGKIYSSPDRLLKPQARGPEGWRDISWAEANRSIGGTVRRLIDTHGPDSIAMYVGTAAGFGVLHPVFAQGFMNGIGSKSMYASATQDCSNKFAVANEVYGFPFTQPFPDLDRVGCLIIVGANPVISKWSFLQVPNPGKTMQEIKARGGRVVVVDPRKTETAKVAGEHLFIRPNTDVFFYLSFLNELETQGGVRADARARFDGVDEVLAVAKEWPSERTATITHITPESLKALVTAYRSANGAALYSSTGVNMGTNGSLAFWLQEAINALSGNLDRPGGTLVGHGVIDFPAFGKKNGVLTRTDRSRIGDFGSVNDAFPGGLLADEILTSGPKQIRALFVTGGNPLITMANAGRLKKAFEQLELLVTVDLFRNETGSVAHFILPATTPFERPDLPFIFPLMLGLQKTPYMQATEALLAPPGEVRDEASIYLDLCRASGVNLFGSAVAQKALEGLMALNSSVHNLSPKVLPQRTLLSMLSRVTGQGGFDALIEHHPHGKKRDAHGGADFIDRRVLTPNRRIQLAPPKLVAHALATLPQSFERAARESTALKLITKRAVQTHNSWTHNIEEFARDGTNYLYVHPSDAERLGLREGAMADVATQTATVRVPVKLLADLMPGTVALPHGWGHQHAGGLSIASKTSGVNVNLLAADGPEALERMSGMAHLTGFAVEVTPAHGPQNPRSWSGL